MFHLPLLSCSPSSWEVEAGIWRQELEQRTYLGLLLSGLLPGSCSVTFLLLHSNTPLPIIFITHGELSLCISRQCPTDMFTGYTEGGYPPLETLSDNPTCVKLTGEANQESKYCPHSQNTVQYSIIYYIIS